MSVESGKSVRNHIKPDREINQRQRQREQKVGFQWCNTAITSACHNLQIYYSGTCQWMLKRIENMSKKEHGAARTETWVTFKKKQKPVTQIHTLGKKNKSEQNQNWKMTWPKNDFPTTSITIRIPDLDFCSLENMFCIWKAKCLEKWTVIDMCMSRYLISGLRSIFEIV